MSTTVGVVGAGVMGRGVALTLVAHGFRTLLVDVEDTVLQAACAEIRNAARLMPMLCAALPRVGSAELSERLQPTLRIEDLAAADFVIENTTERWQTKQPIYRQLDAICRPEAIFAANTSAIPITRLAGETSRPGQVIGMHFMNPAPLKPTVEVIRGRRTTDATVKASIDLAARMGKQSIVVNDSPGFVSNRVMMLTVNEAIYLLDEGVASAVEIDQIFKQCFGHKMGPLETADLIGLDTVLLSLNVLYENLHNDKFRPCPLLAKMVDAGRLGHKSGEGFFRHGPA